MKGIYKLLTITLIFAGLNAGNIVYGQCNDELLTRASTKLGDEFVYLKDVRVRLKESKKNQPPYTIKQSLVLTFGVTYKFVIQNAKEYDGKLVFSLFDMDGVVATNYSESSGKVYYEVLYKCKKSGVYNLTAQFKDGAEGCAVCMVGMNK